ncbi:hypothetical protein BASA81_008702 [Batrachochytrium salamandrivorans]|nr:hypothetical protein BASA81_008702 [Batrachochytrium salamandrivorans]
MVDFRWLDLFPKLREESKRTTAEGGVISLLGIVIAVLLIINETMDFNQIHTVEQFALFEPETTVGVPRPLYIQLEIDFYHLACGEITLGVSTATTTEDSPGAWRVGNKTLVSTNNGAGCLLRARVDLERYESGEMHVALDPGQFGEFTMAQYLDFNTSHQLRAFSFSQPAAQPDQFPPKIVSLGGGTGRFMYDFAVVPERELGSTRQVKFGVRCSQQDVFTKDESEAVFALQRLGLPGVFFQLKLSNLMIQSVVVDKPWYAYVINVLGITAGVPALVALVDSLLHEALWKRKLD